MKLLKEPRDVDFSMRSEPWKEEDLAEFRALIKQQKAKNKRQLKKVNAIKKLQRLKKQVE